MLNVDLGTKGVHESQTIFVRLQIFKSSPSVLNKNLSLFLKEYNDFFPDWMLRTSIELRGKTVKKYDLLNITEFYILRHF